MTVCSALCCLRRWGRFDKDKEIVLAAVARHGAAFAFASADLKADPEVLLVAVEQDATAMLHADPALRASKVRLTLAFKHLYCLRDD